MGKWFHHLAATASEAVGSSWAFIVAVLLVVGWALSGPFFHFSDTWQLIVNTATTISTGLIVFLIQHTQNVKDRAMHKKLDEILRAIPQADNALRGIESEDV